MINKIIVYKRVFYHINGSYIVQVFRTINTEIKPYVDQLPGLQKVFKIFSDEFLVLDGFVKKNPKAFETENIVKKDAGRDFTIHSIIAKVDYHDDFAETEEEKEDIHQLVYIIDSYRGIDKKHYPSETTLVYSMINALEKKPDLLNKFGLTNLVAKLKQQNKDFEVIYNTRTQTVHDKLMQGNVTKYRVTVNDAFDTLCQVIEGMWHMPLSDEERSAVEKIIDIINGEIQKATTEYNRHLGVLTAKKKKEEEKNTAEAEKKTEDETLKIEDETPKTETETPKVNIDVTKTGTETPKINIEIKKEDTTGTGNTE